MRNPGRIGLTIVTLSANAAAFDPTLAISTVPAAHTGSPPRVSSRRRGACSGTNSPSSSTGAPAPVNQPVTSTITWPPLCENTSSPDAVTATIAPAARVWPRPSALIVDVAGSGLPAGNTVKKPDPGDSVNVTVSATATASAGTDGGSATLIVSPAAIGLARGGSRVSIAACRRDRHEAAGGRRRRLDEPAGHVDDQRCTVLGEEVDCTADPDAHDRGVGPDLARAVVDDRRRRHWRPFRPDRDETRPGRRAVVDGDRERDGGCRARNAATLGDVHAHDLCVDALESGAVSDIGEPARDAGLEPRGGRRRSDAVALRRPQPSRPTSASLSPARTIARRAGSRTPHRHATKPYWRGHRSFSRFGGTWAGSIGHWCFG